MIYRLFSKSSYLFAIDKLLFASHHHNNLILNLKETLLVSRSRRTP